MGGLKQPPEDIQFPGIRTLYITLCDKIVMENFSPSSSQCNSTSQVDKIKLKKKKASFSSFYYEKNISKVILLLYTQH